MKANSPLLFTLLGLSAFMAFLLHPGISVSAREVRPQIFLFVVAIPSSAVALIRIWRQSPLSGFKVLMFITNIGVILLGAFTFLLLLPGDLQD